MSKLNERSAARRVNEVLQQYGYRTKTNRDAMVCFKCHTKLVPEGDEPDMLATHPEQPAIYVEYKAVYPPRDKSFSFKQIEGATEAKEGVIHEVAANTVLSLANVQKGD